METKLTKGDKVIIAIWSDSYNAIVTAVSKSGIITVNEKRFKESHTTDGGTLVYKGMWDASFYRVYENKDGSIKARLDPSF